MPSATDELRRELRDLYGVTDREFDQATGVARWRRRGPRADRVDDLAGVVTLLAQSRTLYPKEVGRFLRARNRELGYARPLVLLRRGDYERVRREAQMFVMRLEGQ